jgi:pimeloyl-ACP methyl ester carboxylesterase
MANSYYRLGRGPTSVIALHGWFGDHSAFAPMWPYLDQSRFSYAFMDYRGYGGARMLSGQYTMEEVAADTLQLADALGWQNFVLIGHSMGGKAIQQVLVNAPCRVQKLVAITPVPASGVPFDEQGRALFAGAADNSGNRRAIIDFSTGNRLTSVWLDQMVATSLATSTRDAFAAYLEAWAKGDFHERVNGNPVPVQVIVGEHDPALSADVMRATWMQWYPNATLEVLANAGHYPMDEVPIALATTIERFLAS